MAQIKQLVLVTLIVCSVAAPGWAATVSEWVSGVEMAASAAGMLATGTVAQRELDRAKRTLTEADVMDEDLTDFVQRYTRPDMVAVARRSQHLFITDVSDAVTTVKQLFTLLPLPAQTGDPLRSIVLELEKTETASSMNWDFAVMRRLERKYGPGSAKLNAAEVVLSYALQGLPAFGINRETGYPGAFEPIAAYSVAYLTYSDEAPRAVSVAELGLRRYIFADGWTGDGRLGFIRPRYVSAGFAMSGASDEPMQSPFQGSSRYGAFFGWGELKVAFLGGENKRVLFTQQIQFIPWVF